MGLMDDAAVDFDEILNDTDGPAITASFSGSDLSVILAGYGIVDDGVTSFNYIDVVFRASDVSDISFRNDSITIDGATWRYPRLVLSNAIAAKYRFRNNERPARVK